MPDKKSLNGPFDSDDRTEKQLWSALESVPREAPSEALRRSFYRELENASQPAVAERLREWLGMSSNVGWLTAAAFALLGVGAGLLMNTNEAADPMRLAMLEENVVLLNRQLILDRLEDAAAGKRLRGVIDAGYVAQTDREIARALMVRAVQDDVLSVRSAAIEALGPSLSSTAIGSELMALLENAESPLVQLAMVDLVLRYGSAMQLDQLLEIANAERLHPDLVRHVKKSLGSESI